MPFTDFCVHVTEQPQTKMLNVIMTIVSKMTSNCAGTVHMREDSERGIRK